MLKKIIETNEVHKLNAEKIVVLKRSSDISKLLEKNIAAGNYENISELIVEFFKCNAWLESKVASSYLTSAIKYTKENILAKLPYEKFEQVKRSIDITLLELAQLYKKNERVNTSLYKSRRELQSTYYVFVSNGQYEKDHYYYSLFKRINADRKYKNYKVKEIIKPQIIKADSIAVFSVYFIVDGREELHKFRVGD